MSFAAYPEYKDSGVAWLGEVPAHWEVTALKRHGKLITDRAEKHSFPIALENIEGWTGQFLATDSEFGGEGVAFESGDILYGKLRPYLAKVMVAICNGEAVGDFHVIRVTSENPDYVAYLLRTKELVSIVDGSTYGSKMPRASWDFLSTIFLPFPPLAEQTAIAAFLDAETAKIDALVAEQERLIALLREKRAAVIAHAVTKGLDPHAPMKDSGIEWLGQIPAHWKVCALSYRYNIALGKMLDQKRITGDFLRPYLRNTDVQWGRINADDLPMMDFEPNEVDRYLVRKHDLIVCEGGEVGRAAIWTNDDPVCYQKALHRLRPYDTGLDSTRFAFFIFEASAKLSVFTADEGKATIAHLPAEKLRRYRFAFPPLAEQLQIADYLNSAGERWAATEAAAQSAIALLKERRAALISAAVTGKIDVRAGARRQAA